MKTACLVTVDVEGIPLKNNSMDYSTVIDGIPMLLDLFNEFSIHSTFFVTSDSAKNTEEVLIEITKRKHEIGCHSKGTQNHAYLKKATETIEKYLNTTPIGFRAHRHSINEGTLMSLLSLGYKYDSSVVSSSKILNKEYSPKAPKTPYRILLSNVHHEEPSSLIEIPISSLPIIKLPLTLSYIKFLGLKLYKLFLTRLDQKIVTMYLHPYDLFPLPSEVDAPLRFRLAQTRRAKGFQVFRNLLEYFTEKLAPTYICAREILNHNELVSRGGVEPPVSTM